MTSTGHSRPLQGHSHLGAGYICATEQEAAPFLELACCRLDPVDGRVRMPSLDSDLMICGMGPEPAARAARELVDRGVERLVHFGVCGGLGPGAGPGTVFAMREAVLGDGGSEPVGTWPCDTSQYAFLDHATLVTWPEPVFDGDLRARLSRWGRVVDMEGAAIAREASRAGIPCIIIKAVTDLAGPGERERLLANLAEMSELAARAVWRGLFGAEAMG